MTIQPNTWNQSKGNLGYLDYRDHRPPAVEENVAADGGAPPEPDYAEVMGEWAAIKRYRQFLDIHPPRSGAAGEAYAAGVKARAAGLLIPIAPPAFQTESNWELGEAWRMGWSHEDRAHRAELARSVNECSASE